MDANEKVQIAINTLTAQRNTALNTVVEQQVRVAELEGAIAAVEGALVTANERIAELEDKKPPKPLKHRP